ncbi:hypothetical protein B0T26DRAFT_695739 [Lasiosphaeria miniovina]|uniref:Uncharacterized protein n=1 Tax=Lasiosphaeria miniovina TaxID=1954250 RepID=A0AA40B4X2_9PEZI|nr:uncharacterized protein B0T26DRAFT_695739 [Lasiosphaeria miniovina]KAK0727795.1 hypothetical protein B0T26DRAFT_695739 [Lasiosphaeria miniovina]
MAATVAALWLDFMVPEGLGLSCNMPVLALVLALVLAPALERGMTTTTMSRTVLRRLKLVATASCTTSATSARSFMMLTKTTPLPLPAATLPWRTCVRRWPRWRCECGC